MHQKKRRQRIDLIICQISLNNEIVMVKLIVMLGH